MNDTVKYLRLLYGSLIKFTSILSCLDLEERLEIYILLVVLLVSLGTESLPLVRCFQGSCYKNAALSFHVPFGRIHFTYCRRGPYSHRSAFPGPTSVHLVPSLPRKES